MKALSVILLIVVLAVITGAVWFLYFRAGDVVETAVFDVITPQEPAVVETKDLSISVSKVEIAVNEEVSNVEIKVVKLSGKPSGTAEELEGKAYQYLEISASNLASENISQTEIDFKVEQGWLDKNNIDLSAVALYRLSGAWQKLATQLLSQDSQFAYYRAQTAGLSYFAISGILEPGDEDSQGDGENNEGSGKNKDVKQASLESYAGENGYYGACDFSRGKCERLYQVSMSDSDIDKYDLVTYGNCELDYSTMECKSYGAQFIHTVFQDMGEKELSEVASCPETDADRHQDPFNRFKDMKKGHTYCIKTREGDYVLVRVVSFSGREGEDITDIISVNIEWAWAD